MEKRTVVHPPSKRTQLSSARPAGPSAKVYRPVSFMHSFLFVCCLLGPFRGQNVTPFGAQNPRHGVDDDDDEEEDDDEGPGGDYADGEGDPCPNCGRVYRYSPAKA